MKKLFYFILIGCISVHFSLAQNISPSEQFIDWSDDSAWSSGNRPLSNQGGQDIFIDGSVTRFSNFTLGTTNFFGGSNPSNLTVYSGDSLVVDGDLTINPDSELTVEDGGYLYVNGDLNNQGEFFIIFPTGDGGIAANDGTIAVNGDYNQGPGANISNNGTNSKFYVEGNSDGEPTDGQIPPEIQEIYNTLPIELKVFEGILAKNATQLNWITAKEENFSHFEIERSVNEKPFEVIGLVEGQGNSMTDVYYDFTDLSIPFGIIRYRLKAVDIDHSFEYFEAIEIKNTFSNQVSAYPNPTTNISNVKIVLPKEFKGKLNKVSLFNSSGRNLYNQLNFDPQVSKLELGELEEGMYILKIYHNGLTENLRIFVH
ncbi:T9SS type A sorting domain-containing protein [Marivirga harenae]|uniref:T9SS type A sorting domain-containing protein n=1 Tax=Marivirga harenae TaxID=2010992 RepID=UPI0026E016F5|nr:T9SS type A sorting domain-containing protein [Marivirga harenae]WKV10468.1 T9SS type A sorting domain-containing protein [Marivirga harenae]|tara:strand:- start:406697 stop:407809 length:1113 start_codon:yes stop_codon:yes gene_type:complete